MVKCSGRRLRRPEGDEVTFRAIRRRKIPTGGVDAKNLKKYLEAPFVHAVGGSGCAQKSIAAGNFDVVTLCREASEIVRGGARMKVLTFGEIMLRLKAPGHERFFQSPMLEATFGGGEANVAVSLGKLRHGREF